MKRTATTDRATGFPASPNSVRLAITLPRALFGRIAVVAANYERSLSAQVVDYVTRGERRRLAKGRVSR